MALVATHFVGDHVEEALSGVETSMYSAVDGDSQVCYIDGFFLRMAH
jgi:hypothetical protein